MRLFREHLAKHLELVTAARHELRGYDLACWCPLEEPCHADVLAGSPEFHRGRLSLPTGGMVFPV